ncbi:hypothetical protein T4C_13742 [Trichinella pseudospiralis]|uniref:Uncharacterized protein n=1 Tax=Trichinella pseudospiralis TaxID=6337 RepID=A0A0V1GAU0_TRIPS|nr:hypothetical protein T4C_13742 [Trichinella pseudospiralis]
MLCAQILNPCTEPMFVAFFVVIFYPLPWIMLYASVLNPCSLHSS